MASTASQPAKDASAKPQKPWTPRPNYSEIHRRPLPFEIHPLPAFLPNNPASLVRIAYTIVSQYIWPPKFETCLHQTYFSGETQSVHVTDPKSIRALWEQGFFGTGSLSRSEPQWLDQEKRRQGLAASLTSAEVTMSRREERQLFKLNRAREQMEAIEEQRQREKNAQPGSGLSLDFDLDEQSEIPADSTPTTWETVQPAAQLVENDSESTLVETVPEIQDQEHLQLTLEEAFFLLYTLGAISIEYKGSSLHSSAYLLRLLAFRAAFPPNWTKVPTLLPPQPVAPDNSFLVNYVVYHHFRSLGWVVRSGIKFACDYLIYNRGPAFTHAQFAILVVPSFSHSYWSETPERVKQVEEKGGRDWWWLSRVNRVQTQVMKTLVLVYVEVPPPWDVDGGDAPLDIGAVLKKYTVRETIWKRWNPKKMD